MKASIVITSFNYGNYISRAIRSSLSQTLSKKDYEVIVVDDASQDDSLEIIKSFKNDINLISFPENKGLPSARNAGARAALGQFILFVDADDYIDNSILEYQIRFLSANPSWGAVSCDYILVNKLGEHMARVNGESNPIACGILFRKDLLIEIGLYNEKFLSFEEVELRQRFEKKYTIKNLELPLYRYRKHQSNMTLDKERMDEYKSKLEKINGKES